MNYSADELTQLLSSIVPEENTHTSERAAVDAVVLREHIFTYLLGDESKDGTRSDKSGKEIDVGHYTLKLVTTQSEGRELNAGVFASHGRGPVVLTVPIVFGDQHRYFSIEVVATSGELYNVVAPTEVSNLHKIGGSANMGFPQQKGTNVNNIVLHRTKSGLNVEITYKRVDLITVRAEDGEGNSGVFDLHYQGDSNDPVRISRHTDDEEGSKPIPIEELSGNWTLTDVNEDVIVIENGNIELNTIRRTGHHTDVEANLGPDVQLKPPIEGYTVRMFLFNNQVHVVTYTRLDRKSKYAGVSPVDIFYEIMESKGVDLRSFFPEGCNISPITYFFHVGTNNLVMNSRLNYRDLDAYVMFAFATNTWEYDSTEAHVLDALFGLGEPHYMRDNQLDLLPKGLFQEAEYAYNCRWPKLCHQSNSLRIPVVSALTVGVVGDEVSITSIGSREHTDPRLFPGEAVVAVIHTSDRRKIPPIRFMSPGYNYRSMVRGKKDWPLQAWFRLAQVRSLQIRISSQLYQSLLQAYQRNEPVATLPTYDFPDKMSDGEVITNFIEYITVMWLYALPIHSQHKELEERGGFNAIVRYIRDGMDRLADDIINIKSRQFVQQHSEFLAQVHRRLEAIRGIDAKNRRASRTPPSTTELVQALMGKNRDGKYSSIFESFRKHYFAHIKNQNILGEIPKLVTPDLSRRPRSSDQSRASSRPNRTRSRPTARRGTHIPSRPILERGDVLDL